MVQRHYLGFDSVPLTIKYTMSFFGFDPSQKPRGRGHNTAAPGFSQVADPFAGPRPDNDNEA